MGICSHVSSDQSLLSWLCTIPFCLVVPYRKVVGKCSRRLLRRALNLVLVLVGIPVADHVLLVKTTIGLESCGRRRAQQGSCSLSQRRSHIVPVFPIVHSSQDIPLDPGPEVQTGTTPPDIPPDNRISFRLSVLDCAITAGYALIIMRISILEWRGASGRRGVGMNRTCFTNQ